MNRTAEQFIMALNAAIEGERSPDIHIIHEGGSGKGKGSRWTRLSPNYPGDGNRLVRRTAAAQNRLRARDVVRPKLSARA